MCKNTRTLWLGACFVIVCSGSVRGSSGSINEKLNRTVKVELNNVTIVQAMEEIGKKAEIDFVISDEAVWKLPNGRSTRLSVMLDGPLSESLRNMLNVFFMRYAVGPNDVTIYPREELNHILGRPSARQLELLRDIYTKPITEYVGTIQGTINGALGEPMVILPHQVIYDLDEIIHTLSGKDLRKPRSDDYRFALAGPVTVASLLNSACAGRSVLREWFLSAMEFDKQIAEIHLVTAVEFIEARLDQRIDVSYEDRPLDEVLMSLASMADMQVIADPDRNIQGWSISANIQNTTIRQAITSIITSLGGNCSTDARIKRISVVMPSSKGAQAIKSDVGEKKGIGDDAYVGKISIPMDDGKYFLEFMLRESDLSEKLKALRADKFAEIMGDKAGVTREDEAGEDVKRERRTRRTREARERE
ncbi:MAG: hypothetical protein ABIG61_12105 [Planctomycetota bacterium]